MRTAQSRRNRDQREQWHARDTFPALDFGRRFHLVRCTLRTVFYTMSCDYYYYSYNIIRAVVVHIGNSILFTPGNPDPLYLDARTPR